MNNHLVILKKSYLGAILDGRKKIESSFSRARHPAFGRVLPGDRLFLKVSSGPVRATATVTAVKTFEDLSPHKMLQIKRRHNRYILGGEEYWRSKMDCRFGFLVWLREVQRVQPVKIGKKDWRAWVILTEEQDFGLLKTASATR